MTYNVTGTGGGGGGWGGRRRGEKKNTDRDSVIIPYIIAYEFIVM